MPRILSLLIALCLLFLAACDGGAGTVGLPTGSPSPQNGSNGPLVTPPEKPPGVPAQAQAIVQTTRLGRIERRANQPPQAIMTRELLDGSCTDGVMTIETSQGTIYAGLPCDRFWNQEAKETFSGRQVAIVLEVTSERFRVLIETVEGAQAEFTVEGIWVE